MSTQRRTFLKTWWSPYLGEWRPFHDNYIYASNTGCTFSGSAEYSPVPPTPSNTATPTQTMTPSETPTLTPTNTQTLTQTSTPTNTPSNTPTETPQVTPTNTNTSTVTPTMTNTPSSTISNCNYLYFSSATFNSGISNCPNPGDSYNLNSSEFQGNYYLSDDGVSQAKYMSYVNATGTTTCGSLTGTNYSMWIKYPTNSSGITIAIAAVTNLLIRANDFHFIFYSGGTYVGNCGTTNTCMGLSLFINTGDTVNGLLYPATSGFLSAGGNAVPFTIDYFCPSPTPTNTTTNTSTPTLTPSVTQTQTPQPTSTTTQTNTPSTTVTLSPTVTQTQTPSNTTTPSITPSQTGTPQVTPTNTVTPTKTAVSYAYHTTLSGFSSTANACASGQTCEQILYSADNPLVSSIPRSKLYTDAGLTTLFVPPDLTNNRYALSYLCGGTWRAAQITSIGEVFSIGNC